MKMNFLRQSMSLFSGIFLITSSAVSVVNAQMASPGLPSQTTTLQNCNAGVGAMSMFMYDNRLLFSAYPTTGGDAYRYSNQGAARIYYEPWGNHISFQFSNLQGYGITTPYGSPVSSWVTALAVSGQGNVGVGTNDCSTYKLNVKGKIGCEEVNVRTFPWCDYVFEPDYKLMPLYELQQYINANKHLPEIPDAKTVEGDGLDLGTMSTLHMKKIEELTLYILELQKQIDELKKQVENLQN